MLEQEVYLHQILLCRAVMTHSFCTLLSQRVLSMFFLRRVMVLDAGKIVEFDSPSNPLEKQGHFYAMAKDAGITRAEITAL